MYKTAFFLFISFILNNVIYAQKAINEQKTDFNKAIKEFILDSDLLNSSISFYAIDLNTDEEIGKINPELRLSPASTMKLFTTAAALEILGEEKTFKTKIGYSGAINESGFLNGNIIIKGGGDPCFMSHNFNSTYYNPEILSKIISEIIKSGIKKINGSIVGDASYYSDNSAPSTWILADVANYYGGLGDQTFTKYQEYDAWDQPSYDEDGNLVDAASVTDPEEDELFMNIYGNN